MIASVPPTPRQMEVLRFIAGYLEAHDGISPKHQEIVKACGLSGKSSVTRMLNALEERGHIHRLRGRHQAITLLRSVSVPRAPGNGEPLYFVRAGTSAGDPS